LRLLKSILDVTAEVPGADKQAFETAANNAKAGCPVSKLLKAGDYDGRQA